MFIMFLIGLGMIFISLAMFPKNNPSVKAVANDMGSYPGQWLALLLVLILGATIVLTIR